MKWVFLASAALPSLVSARMFQSFKNKENKFLSKEKKSYSTSKDRLKVGNLAPYYHTSEQIHEAVTELANNCQNGNLSVQTKTSVDGNGYNVAVDVVDITSNDSAEGTEKNKFFILFGEHARELISPESALHFLQTLCGESDLSTVEAEKIKKTLSHTDFRIITNGNPNSREKVEEGDYCLRVNGNGVDLNRNWAEHWEPEASEFASVDTNPGPHAFSEPETNIFKEVVSDYQPNGFLTIHSGTKGMYMPWAYDMEHLAKKNGKAMEMMLRQLDTKYCQCPFGAAGKEVGYSCPGTCLDYVYEKLGVQYSFAFEIFTWKQDWGDLESRFEDKMQQPSDFIQTEMETQFGDDPEECFERFNPATEADFKETLDTWSNAYLDLAEMIDTDIKAKNQAPKLP